MLGQVTRVYSLAYDTYNYYIKWLSKLYVKLVLEEIKNGGGGLRVIFFVKMRGKTFLQLEKGSQNSFFLKN